MTTTNDTAARSGQASSGTGRIISTSRRILVFAAFAVLGYSAAYLYGTAYRWRDETSDRTFHRSITVVNESDLRFSTGARPDYTLSIALENHEDVPISISHIEASCGCTRISPANLTLPPRGQGSVLFEFDLTGVRGGSPLPVPFDVSVFMHEKIGPKRKVERFKIAGKVFQPFSFSREPIEIYGTPPEASARGRLTLQSALPLTDIEVKSAAADWDVSLSTAAPKAPQSFAIDVVPKSKRPAGLVPVPFSIDARREDGTAMPTVVLRAPVNVMTRVRALPSAVDLGALDLGAKASFSIHLTAIDGSHFEVRAVGHPACVATSTDEPVASPAANVHGIVTATREGFQQVPLKVEVTYPNDVLSESLTIPLRYFGRGKSGTTLVGTSP